MTAGIWIARDESGVMLKYKPRITAFAAEPELIKRHWYGPMLHIESNLENVAGRAVEPGEKVFVPYREG